MGRVTVQHPAGGDFWEKLGKTFVEVYANTASGSREITLDAGKEYLVIAVSLGSAPWQSRAWELYRVRDGALTLAASHTLGNMEKMTVALSGNKLSCSHYANNCYFTLAVAEVG